MMGKSHKFNDRDHAGLADGTALPEEHLPRYFAKSGHIDMDPKKTKKNGAGKGGWGVDGEEVQDEGFTMTNTRRRSNSSSYIAGLKDFKTKFEQIEADPVFEEDIHGAMEDLPETTRVNTDSSEGGSVDEDIKSNPLHKQPSRKIDNMPYKLKGRNVLVTGGTRGLGEAICLKFAAEGCNIAINYVSSEQKAGELKARIEKEFGVRVVTLKAVGWCFSFGVGMSGKRGVGIRRWVMRLLVPCVDDMAVEKECIHVVEETIKRFGGLDILISNAGYTRFSTFSDLNAPIADDWQKCYAVNVVAQSILMRTALPTFEANAEGGVFIITSSIAGVIAGGSCMPYSVTKAAQLHLMKCLAATQGPKVRVNAILPGLLLTEWGNKYGEESIKDLEEKAFLKRVGCKFPQTRVENDNETNEICCTDIEDCAQAFVDVARNSSMTGQKIQVDSGLAQNV
ncbi:hypothetical protein CJF31_00011672 [Rutstroemia sp. NJR-2017a BVV2]|nr:hypothetical protein CJF31_00011672 [Rutstroemia sp. NJR-2017a BVV2]